MEDLKLAILIDADNISPKYVKVILDEAATFGVADGYSRVVTSKHRCSMDAADKPTSAAGRKALDDPRIHRYYVRLTSEQNERFLRMYEHSGMKNKADFICHRIFG